MKDGDIISLLWHRNDQNKHHSVAQGESGKATTMNNDYPLSSAVLEPLIHYRLVWNDEEDGTIVDDENANTIIDGNNHPLQLGLAEEEEEDDDDAEIRMTNEGGGDIQMVDARSAVSNNIGCDNDKENESEQHSDRSEEEIVRGEQPIDDMDNDSKGSCNIDHDCDANDDCEDEDEDESAPLTLPSRFLSSYSNSFSFDSIEKLSPSQPSANTNTVSIDIDANILNHATTTEGKTYGDNISSMDPIGGGTMDTPKKTNVTMTLRESMISVPITSLSYDQLVRIHEEMTHPIFSATKKPSSSSSSPSIRHTVLSLTLSLSSNVSPYQSKNVLSENNANAYERSISKVVGIETNTSDQKKLPQHWMPRLLFGTRINVHNNTDIT